MYCVCHQPNFSDNHRPQNIEEDEKILQEYLENDEQMFMHVDWSKVTTKMSSFGPEIFFEGEHVEENSLKRKEHDVLK